MTDDVLAGLLACFEGRGRPGAVYDQLADWGRERQGQLENEYAEACRYAEQVRVAVGRGRESPHWMAYAESRERSAVEAMRVHGELCRELHALWLMARRHDTIFDCPTWQELVPGASFR